MTPRLRRGAWIIAALATLTALLALASLFVGTVSLPPGDVVRGLGGGGNETAALIVREIRLPRTLLAALVGAALGLSGAAMQGLLRNPLAEPGVTGVSAMAGLGAVIALYFGIATAVPLALPGFAFAGALLAAALLFALAARDASTLTLILAGVALSSLAVALMSLAMNLAPNPYALAELVFWLLGTVKDRSLNDVLLAAPFIAAGAALIVSSGRGLDALTLGEDAAASLGVDLKRLRAIVVTGVALTTGAAVAVSGAIGFVGLVVPHLMRPLFGHEPSRLLVPSALAGAALLVAADIVVRALPTGAELMLGVVTSLVGAPFFLYLIFATRRSMR